jgi:hypothetical protein
MSYTEVRHSEGMPYGGMPHDVLLRKLEETDPDLVDEARGAALGDEGLSDEELGDGGLGDGTPGDDYGAYARSEIIDWAQDAPYLESDQTRRDSGLSRSMLNLRYNGTRGSDPEPPRHPDLFYGFLGNDPRGAGNDPRLEQVRAQLGARGAGLAVRMGDNDDNHLAERPWTGQSISYGMKEVHRRLKGSTHVFSRHKEGAARAGNIAADARAARRARAAVLAGGSESLSGKKARFAGGDHAPAGEAHTGGVRGFDAHAVTGAEAAPWRHATGEADLGVQSYGRVRGAGRAAVGGTALGGARAAVQSADQAWNTSATARAVNRHALAATMATAARARRAVKGGAHDQDQAIAYEAGAAPGGGLVPAQDLARQWRHAVSEQARAAGEELQEGAGGALGAAAGLTPAVHPERALRAGEAHVSASARLAEVGAVVAGLREGSAAARRRVAGAVVASGARCTAVGENEGAPRQAAPVHADPGRITRASKAVLARAAAGGLVVHTYRAAPVGKPEARVAKAQGAYDATSWRPQLEAQAVGQSRPAGEWRSATQGGTTLGSSAARVFGRDAEVAGYHGAAPMGPKALRAGGWSEGAPLSDEVGGEDGIARA